MCFVNHGERQATGVEVTEKGKVHECRMGHAKPYLGSEEVESKAIEAADDGLLHIQPQGI
jgi:hypothetical protein